MYHLHVTENPKPTEILHTKLNLSEYKQRLKERLCPHQALSQCLSYQSFKLDLQIRLSESVYFLLALINSGAARKFMDSDTMQGLQMPTQALQWLLRIRTIDSGPIGSGIIMSCTKALLLQVSTSHFETI